MRIFKLLYVVLIGAQISCSHEIDDPQKYLRLINNPENGLVKQKEVGDLKLDVKYLTPDLQAWKELKDRPFEDKERDSLSDFYKQSLTFLLSVNPDSSKGAADDILYRGISNEKEFKQRVHQLNFGIERMIKLIVGKSEYYPALAVMENTYGTSLSKNFYVVFSAEDRKRIGDNWKTLDFVFADEIFSTGINHFIFDKEAFNDIPVFNFRYHKTN